MAPIYNIKELKGKPPLRFTGEVLADIFRGKIVKWNDAALKSLNEGVSLPDAEITVVHRQDSSGTTFLFTDYLQGASPAWRAQIGPAASKVEWPVGIGALRNPGLAAAVQETEGSLGYVDLIQWCNNKFPMARSRRRQDGVHPRRTGEHDRGRSGAGQRPFRRLDVHIDEPAGQGFDPICGAIWAVCYQNQPASDEKNVMDFLQWATHDGQQFAKSLAYAPLPPALVGMRGRKTEAD